MYGTYESLKNHMKDKHTNKFTVYGIPSLMNEVMKHYIINNQKPLYFCSHCNQITDTQIHSIGTKFRNENNKKCTIDFYCNTCKVSFISTIDMIHYHSLSVEHMTIKCFDNFLFGKSAKMNAKKIIPFKHLSQNKDNNGLSAVQNIHTNNAIRLPMIILNRFTIINKLIGECKLCNSFIIWDDKSILNHLSLCKLKYDLTVSNNTTVRAFKCIVCDYLTDNINGHIAHITSYLHLASCYNTVNYYSYVCNVCNVYMYSHITDIISHCKLDHKDTKTKKLPRLFIFMKKKFDDFNRNSNIVEITSYSDNEIYDLTNVSNPCTTCKIEFHTAYDYNMHEITSEHIILKYLTPKEIVENINTLKRKSYKLPSIIQDSSLLQNHVNLKERNNKNEENLQVNKSESNNFFILFVGHFSFTLYLCNK